MPPKKPKPEKVHKIEINNHTAMQRSTTHCPGCKARLSITIDTAVATAVLLNAGYDVSLKRPSERTLAKRQARAAAEKAK